MATFTLGSNSPTHSTGSIGSSSGRNPSHKPALLRPFRSQKIRPEDMIDWTREKRTRREKFARMTPWIAFGVGIVMCIVGAIWGWADVPKHTYTQVWYEDFSSGKLDLVNDFNREVSFGSFGAHSFEWNTNFDNNSYVKDRKLHIHPRMTDEYWNTPGASLNLTETGECTVPYTDSDCFAQRNISKGAWFNAMTSARLTTKDKHFIRFGRVEVHAKMGLGDWLWNAVWLHAQNDTYGTWPATGEIDLIEHRGNKPGYAGGGYEVMQSSIHAAPIGAQPGMSRLPIKKRVPSIQLPFSEPAREFHTYGVDITPQFVHIWWDSPINIALSFPFHSDPWTNFDLAPTWIGQTLPNPWLSSRHKCAPFDQAFYLVLNVAVAGNPGYFGDARQAPWGVETNWYNGQRQIWDAREEFSHTWTEEEVPMKIEWIRMSQLDDVDKWLNQPSALY
ncbi:hypothetical protein PYCC9005_002088 [Savitreella phatthalungensis]